jgi:hypothetical protein
MYISNEFVDREGLKVLFPNVSQSRINDLWNVNIFGTPTQFSGFDVVDRAEAVRAGEIVFSDDQPKKKASDREPEQPAYTAEDQKQLNIYNDVIARYGNNKSQEDQLRVLFAKKNIAKIEKKYAAKPAVDKKAIQSEIEQLEEKKQQLWAKTQECHKTHTPVPDRDISEYQRCKRRITELQSQL